MPVGGAYLFLKFICIIVCYIFCGYGGIGRHKGLKIPYVKSLLYDTDVRIYWRFHEFKICFLVASLEASLQKSGDDSGSIASFNKRVWWNRQTQET